jgi:hypothetical protein
MPMPRRSHSAFLIAFLITMVLCAGFGCTKKEAPPAATTAPSDLVIPAPTPTNQAILEKTFNLKGSATFPFEIPAHAALPHLHGIFQSFAGQAHGPSDETADIDFMVLNEAQQADFAANRPGEVLFSADASHNQSVNFDLPPSNDHPVKYYLVFRNSEGSKSNKVVEANFRVDF